MVNTKHTNVFLTVILLVTLFACVNHKDKTDNLPHHFFEKTGTESISIWLNSYANNETNIRKTINFADQIIAGNPFGDTIAVYAADFLYQHATILLNQKLQKKLWPWQIAHLKKVKETLKTKGFICDTPLTKTRKIFINIKQKNFRYLAQRAGIIPKRGIGIIAPNEYSIEIDTKKLLNKSTIMGRHYPAGQLIVFSSKGIHIEYINGSCQQIVRGKVNECRNNTLLISSATFMNSELKPIGFNISNGIKLNKGFHPTWNGLAFVENGRLEVLPVFDVCKNFNNYLKLRDLCSKNKSGVFQTPLFIADGELLIDTVNKHGSFREHRFLIVFSDINNLEYIAFANFESPGYLYHRIKSLKRIIEEQSLKIVHLCLLDVGSNNLFHLYNTDGSRDYGIKSILRPGDATNALIVMQALLE